MNARMGGNHRRGPRRRRGRSRFRARPFLLLAVLAGLFVVNESEALPPVGPLASDREVVERSFTRCGRGRGYACVIDGDTFKLGDRKIRIAGINAPELKDPRCAEETRLAEQATAKLQQLLNQGAFTMVANRLDRTDRYGRELRRLSRSLPGGETQSIGAELREAGLAHPYLGHLEPGWC